MAALWFQLCMNIIRRYFALVVLLLFFGGNSVSSIPVEELDSMLALVRARGYNLFANAIATTDLGVDLLTAPTNSSFTFFAPTDASLFALAMTQSPPSYTATLRYHGLPRRLSMSDLRRFRSRTTLPTLLPSQYVLLTRRRRSSRSGAISVNGVNVVLPGLYNGRRVAVHGLGGILSLRSDFDIVYGFPTFPSPRPGIAGDVPPEFDRGSDENRTFAAPAVSNRIIDASPIAPMISPSTGTDTTDILPINHTFLDPAPTPALFPVKSPESRYDSSLQDSIFSPPSESPGFPPEISPLSNPSMNLPEIENAVTPAPLRSGKNAGETPPRMETDDHLSGITVENHEPSEWMTLDFAGGKPKVEIEDSHPHV